MNGREVNQKIGDKIKYGMFSVGLLVYDYESGKEPTSCMRTWMIHSCGLTP